MDGTTPVIESPTGLAAPLNDQPVKANPAHYRSLELSEEDQKSILSKCNDFKSNTSDAFKEKRESMRRAFAYYKMKFMGVGNDLLPIVASEGGERDAQSDRPKVFLPLVRQVVIQLYSQLKLSLHPSDNGYFRIKGRTEEAAETEDELTEAMEVILEDMQFTEKMGRFYLNLSIFGSAINYPCIDIKTDYTWIINEITNSYEMIEEQGPPTLDIKVWSPMNFSPDPSEPFGPCSRWVYSDTRKKHELIDSELYFNKDQLKEHKRKESNAGKKENKEAKTLNIYSGLSESFRDIEDVVDYDLYYMPYIKVGDREFRNMMIGIVDETIVVRFFPNLAPRGRNPVIYCDWRPDPASPLGDGPAEDVCELQRMINMLENYKLESLARNGNRWAVPHGTDTSSLFSIPGGVVYFDPLGAPPQALSGNVAEYGALQNEIGVLKAEAQIVSGSNQPFQGSSAMDFQKTATELSIINEGAMTIMREVIEHAAVVGLKTTLEMIMHLAAMAYKGITVEVRHEDEEGDSEFSSVDISALGSGDYKVEITSVNPTLSKQSQSDLLMKIYETAVQNPLIFAMLKSNGWVLMKQIFDLAGMKNMDFAKTPSEIRMQMRQAAMNAPVDPNAQGGVPNDPGNQPQQ